MISLYSNVRIFLCYNCIPDINTFGCNFYMVACELETIWGVKWQISILSPKNPKIFCWFFFKCYNYIAHSGLCFPHISTKIAQTENFLGVKSKFAIWPLQWPLVHMLPCRNCTQMYYYYVYNCNKWRSSQSYTVWSHGYWAIFLIFIFSLALRKQ